MYDTLSSCKKNDCLASESLLHEENSSFPLYTQHAVLFLLLYTVARVQKSLLSQSFWSIICHIYSLILVTKNLIALLLKL